MKHSYIYLAVLALAGCTGGDEPAASTDPTGAAEALVTASIASRASGTAWQSGDEIGISTTGSTQFVNMAYTTTGSGIFTHVGGAATGIFLSAADTLTFSAYYPFTGHEGTSAGVISDISTENQANQPAFDFLFADHTVASQKSPAVALAFKHKMTRLNLSFKTDTQTGFTAADIYSATFALSGIKHHGEFDTATGIASATDTISEDWQINAEPYELGYVLTYPIILFPQPDATVKVSVSLLGSVYTCTLYPALSEGVSYSYNITIKESGLDVGNCTISQWIDAEAASGSAEMK